MRAFPNAPPPEGPTAASQALDAKSPSESLDAKKPTASLDSTRSTMRSSRSRIENWKRPILALLALALLIGVGRVVPVGAWLVAASAQLRTGGFVGGVLFVLSYSVGALLVIPAAMFTFVAGYSFGALGGALIAIPGIATSSMAIFLLARFLLRNTVQRWLLRDPRYLALDRLLAKLGPRAVVLLRLSPITPFSVLNYAFGLTAIPTRDYFLATCIGTIPGSLFYAQLGAVAPSLARIAEGRLPETGRAQTFLLIFGLVVTAVVAVWLGRIAKRTIAEASQPSPDPPATHSS